MIASDPRRVIVVGAGPVGLVLACELQCAGVDVVVLSRSRHHTAHSRATILWPRVLELLDRTGVAAQLIAGGHYFDQMNYYSNKRRIGRIRFDRLATSHYPFAVTIPQWRTESILESCFQALGGTIRYGCDVVGAQQDADRASVEVRRDDGVTEWHEGSWVVGADGFASAVREHFDFDFEGRALTTKLAITDATIVGEVTSSEAGYYLTREGNMVLAPLGGGVFRVGASVPRGHDETVADRDFFEKLLARRVPGTKRLGVMNFSGIFEANVRSAGRFRDRRVFLVGDAAHVMSPSGAQGLNTGIQDAVNLGWRLAGVATGRYDERILDDYDTERRPAAGRVAELSTRLSTMSLLSGRVTTAARDVGFRALQATGYLDDSVAPRVAQLDTDYGTRNGSELRPGVRLPLGWTPTVSAPVLDRATWTLLLWPGEQYEQGAWQTLADELTATTPGVRTLNLAGRPPGRLLPMVNDLRASALLVRPDGHLEVVVDLSTEQVARSAARVRAACRIAGLLDGAALPPPDAFAKTAVLS